MRNHTFHRRVSLQPFQVLQNFNDYFYFSSFLSTLENVPTRHSSLLERYRNTVFLANYSTHLAWNVFLYNDAELYSSGQPSKALENSGSENSYYVTKKYIEELRLNDERFSQSNCVVFKNFWASYG